MATVTGFFRMDYLLLLLPVLAFTAQRNQGCDGPSTLGGKSGNITSPNFPRAYNGNTVCEWTVNVPINRLVKLTFVDFELEGGRNCNYDSVEVRDGHLPFSPLLGKYCGNRTTFHVFSSSQNMFVRFKSDNSLNNKGFHAIFTAVVTKGNECEKRWHYFEDSAYKFCDIPTRKWIVAQKTCQDLGADLIKISTERENMFVYKIQKSLEFQSSWLGLIRSADNTFYWSDGTSLNYTKWGPSEPCQDGGVRKDCAELIGGYWRNVQCDKAHQSSQFVCEKKNYLNKCQKYPLLTSSEASTKSKLTASSYKDLLHDASNGVLSNTKRIWCPGSNTAQEWIQVDLGKLHVICGVAAVNNIIMNNRSAVTWYRVYSFVTRPDDSSQMKSSSQEFHTNTAVYKADIRDFQRIARYLRFVSTRSRVWPCMKIEVYGEGKVQKLQMTFPISNKTVDTTVVSSTSFRCLALGYPSPSYKWFKDGAEVIPNGILSEQNSSLQLTRLDLSSKGWYTCTATNVLGSVNSTAYLMVTMNSIPTLTFIQGLPRRTSTMKGNETLLLCEGKANSKPLVTWFKNGQPVKENGRVTIMESWNITLQSSLRITNTDYRDAGVYKCVFNGTDGAVFSRGTVVVQAIPCILQGLQRNIDVEGNIIFLSCKAEGKPKSTVTWLKDERPLKNDKRIAISQSGDDIVHSTLLINGTGYRDGGVYKCLFNNTAGAVSSSGTVTVQATSLITEGLSNITYVSRGETFTLNCRDKATPQTAATWFKEGQLLKNNRRTSVSHYVKGGIIQSTLQISRTLYEDSGTYECLFSNNVSVTFSVGRVFVQGGPEFIMKPKRNQSVVEGDDVRLQCKVFAVPAPVIRWKVNGKYLDRPSIDENGTLVIRSVKNNADFEGTYECEASNTFDKIIAVAKITVYSPPSIERPLWVHRIMTRNQTAVIYCHATADPKPQLLWSKDGVLLQETSRVYFQNYKQTLIIQKVEKNDSGVYECSVTNVLGNATAVRSISVFAHPVITTPRETGMSVVQGRSAVLHCRTKGNPTPTLEWRKDGIRLLQTARLRFQNNKQVLKILRLEKQDSGLYECLASNIIGTVIARNNVSVFGEPEINTDLTKAEVTTTLGISATIKCFAANPLPVRYHWTKNMAALHNTEHVKVYNNLLVVTPSDLEDFGAYVCHVTNIAGYTNFSISLVQLPGENHTSVLAEASGFTTEDVGIILAIAIPVVVVILVLLAVAIVHFYRRSRHK